MAINFPDSPTNGQVATIGGKNYTYNSTKNTWTPTQVTEADLSSVGSTTVVATHDLLPSSPSAGDMALVSSVNKMYVYFLSGWWLMSSLQNASPSGITGNAALYDLAADGTPTTVTLSSSDPEGFPISWSHSVISGSLGGTTVTNVDNVFTITPSTDAADAGTFTLRFAAADGQGGESGSQSNFTLDFVFIVANSRYTTLLATATGTSDNNNITDTSSNSHSITVNGDAYTGTFSPYRSGGYSLEFNGSNSRIGIQSSNVQIGTNAFTMEFWLYSRAHSGSISSKYSSSNSNGYFLISTTSTEGFRCRTRSTGGTQKYVNTGSGSYNLNEWNHCIFQRDAAGNLTSYLNGTKYTGENDGSTNLSATELGLGVFNYIGYEGWLDGYIRDFKLTIGTSALRTDSTITVPTEPLASDSNTTAFLGHLPYLADGSSSPNSIVSSNASTSPFSPYDYNEYSTTDHGGSINFDGTTDYLLINSPPTLGANDWTFETWYYASNPLTAHNVLLSQGPGNNTIVSSFSISNTGEIWIQTYTTNNVVLYNTAAGIIKGGTWNHIVLTHDYDGSNGGTYKIYVNGNQVGSNVSYTSGYYWNSGGIAGTALGMAQYRYNTQANGECYFSDWKISSGVTYSSNFTPPTAPLSSTGAELHIKGTDASIIDKSQGSNLKLIGDTTGSTTQAKFSNTKSMYFDGTGDYIISQEPVLLETQDFTAECWVYYQSGLELMGNRTTSDSGGFSVRMTATSLTVGNSSGSGFGSVFSGTTSSLTNAWHHIAVSRSSGVTKIYVDGTSIASHSSSIDFSLSNPFVIGYAYTNGSGADSIQGYIQDFRVTKGYARYTSNFTPPTASLEG